MPISQCPGQDKRFWKPDDIFESPCPACGAAIEFWKDDVRRRCRGCGATAANPRFDMGCAAWCQFAEQCLGAAAVRETEDVAGALIAEMKKVFGSDERRIRHALGVLDYAERILAREGGDPLVVKAAAILHDIGIHEAERKDGAEKGTGVFCAEHPKGRPGKRLPSPFRRQEEEGPPIARQMMERVGVDAERAEHVCRIVGSHHSGRGIDTAEFRAVWDADWLVNLFHEEPRPEPEAVRKAVEQTFKTATGRDLARLLAGRGRPMAGT
jgi:hypothetical protein